MKSALRLTALLLLTLPAAACASSTTIVANSVACSALIPSGWTEPVPSAELPAEPSDERDWMVFGVSQTGALRTANGRTSDVIAVVRACEARDAAAVLEIERPWYSRLAPG